MAEEGPEYEDEEVRCPECGHEHTIEAAEAKSVKRMLLEMLLAQREQEPREEVEQEYERLLTGLKDRAQATQRRIHTTGTHNDQDHEEAVEKLDDLILAINNRLEGEEDG